MAVKKRDVVLIGKNTNGDKTIDMPITRLGNIEDSAAIKEKLTSGDYIPIMDMEDGGQMKKTSFKQFFQSNFNLLHNPNFKINQRGQSSYNKSGYSADRWWFGKLSTVATVGTLEVLSNGGVKITSGGTRLDSYIRQHIEIPRDALIGKTFTVSWKISELSGRFKFTQFAGTSGVEKFIDTDGIGSYTFVFGKDEAATAYPGIQINNDTANASMVLEWMQLEPGSIATPFIPPDPVLELVKCKRYYRPLADLTGAPKYVSKDAKTFNIYFMEGPMRVAPSIEMNNAHLQMTDITGNPAVSCTSTTDRYAVFSPSGTPSREELLYANINYTINGPVATQGNPYVGFSADL